MFDLGQALIFKKGDALLHQCGAVGVEVIKGAALGVEENHDYLTFLFWHFRLRDFGDFIEDHPFRLTWDHGNASLQKHGLIENLKVS